MSLDGVTVTVHHRDDVVVLAARGDVRDDPATLLQLVGVALVALDDQPAVIDVCDLYVHRQDGLAALRWLLLQRPPGALTVVLARTALRRRLHGVFGAQVAWYPAELHTPWIGVSASLSHRRRHLPVTRRQEDTEARIGTLLWAAARERQV
jgi:hypothetical protein